MSYSNVCIQHITSVKCGEFCVAFIKSVRSKNDYEQFLSHFNSLKLEVNDYIVDFMLKWNKVLNINLCFFSFRITNQKLKIIYEFR